MVEAKHHGNNARFFLSTAEKHEDPRLNSTSRMDSHIPKPLGTREARRGPSEAHLTLEF